MVIGAAGVGGVLLIPALMFFGGFNTHEAMATALFSFFFTGIVGTFIYHRYGSIDWKITVPVLFSSFFSSYAGAHVNSLSSARQLDSILAMVIIFSSLYSILSSGNKSGLAQRLDKRGNIVLLLGLGVFIGFICGMTGAGGGIVSIPVMLIAGYTILPTIATSQTLQSVISFSGSASNLLNGFVDFSIVWWVTACELVGVLIGVRIAHAVPVASLKKTVTAFCLLVGLIIGLRVFW